MCGRRGSLVADLYRYWGYRVLLYPPYSTELSPCGYDLIQKMKERVRAFVTFDSEMLPSFCRQWITPETSTEQSLLQGYYDFHIAGNELLTMLVTTLKDSRIFTEVSLPY